MPTPPATQQPTTAKYEYYTPKKAADSVGRLLLRLERLNRGVTKAELVSRAEELTLAGASTLPAEGSCGGCLPLELARTTLQYVHRLYYATTVESSDAAQAGRRAHAGTAVPLVFPLSPPHPARARAYCSISTPSSRMRAASWSRSASLSTGSCVRTDSERAMSLVVSK